MKTPCWQVVLGWFFVICAAHAQSISSPLAVSIRSGEEVSYQILSNTGDNSVSSAWDLPPGLNCDSSGLITGRVNYTNSTGTLATYSSGVYQSGDDGSASATVVWTVTPILQATVNPSISPTPIQHIGQAVTLTRDGTAYNGVTWAQTIITRPNGTQLITSYGGLGSATYTLDGGVGLYTYELKLGDATGAGLCSAPIIFYGQQITPTLFSPANPKVGELVGFGFSTTGPAVSGAGVTTNASLDAVVTSTLVSASPGYATALIRPLARDTGQHWIWMSFNNGNWWGNGFFLPVEKATPIQSAQSITLAAGTTGTRTLAAGDLYVNLTNPYYSALQATELTQIEYRIAFSNVVLSPGYQLASGSYYVDAKFLGNNDYNPSSARGYVSVSGPTSPSDVYARAPTATSVELRWSYSSGATSYAIYRDGAYLGFSSIGLFTDTTATAGAAATYTVKALDNAGRSSLPASISFNALDVFAPGI